MGTYKPNRYISTVLIFIIATKQFRYAIQNSFTLYALKINKWKIRVNKGTLRKLIKSAITWLYHLPKQVFQRGRKSRLKI